MRLITVLAALSSLFLLPTATLAEPGASITLTSSATTTYTITRTVLRVVETATMSGNGTASTGTALQPSGSIVSVARNGTGGVYATGTGTAAVTQTPRPMNSSMTGAAAPSNHGVDFAAVAMMAAAAGLTGMFIA